jgi:uncharacterized membrane protein
MKRSPWNLVFIAASLAGFAFASVSTHDFVQHLDRQVHSITCSFLPGLATPAMGESGCQVTLMSPYSSVFRTWLWGGLPISLPAMAVFAFLAFRGIDLLVNQTPTARAPRVFLVAAAALPAVTSLVMGYIAMNVLDAACKLCIGIYVSSFVALVAAVLEWRTAPSAAALGQEPEGEDANPARSHAVSVGQGVGFVLIPTLLYGIIAPDQTEIVQSCGELAGVEAPAGVMVPLDQNAGAKAAVEVLDPMCPACRAFEGRLEASGLGPQVNRSMVLFPLDHCNWNVGQALHPGACVVSEAVLCAGDRARDVLSWSYAHQAEIKDVATAAAGPEKEGEPAKERNARVDAAVTDHVSKAFPDLKACIGTPAVKKKLGDALRWASRSQLPVTTPQLYIEGRKLCDEDTDLGMDFALSRLLSSAAATPSKEATP